LKRSRGDDATALPQPVNKIRQLTVWNRGMVTYILHACPGWQDLREMSAPLRRVLARAHAARFCQCENCLNASTKAARRFRFRRPDRLQRCKDVLGGNFTYGDIPERRVDIGGERASPFLSMLGVTPADLMR